MSFGVVQSMIASLKNNSRKKELKHFDRSGMPIKIHNINFEDLLNKEVSPEKLKQIKKGLRTYNKNQNRKAIVVTTTIILALSITIFLALR